MGIDGDRKDLLGMVLANHILIQVADDLAGGRNLGKRLFARPAAAAFLIQDRLAQVDALAAGVDVAGAFDQGTDVAITLATEGTEGVFLRSPAAAAA